MSKRLTAEILRKVGINLATPLDALSKEQLRLLVKLCADHSCYFETTHSQQRRFERKIDASQMVATMSLGQVIYFELGIDKEPKLTLGWKDAKEGETIGVVAAIKNILGPCVVVTCYVIDE